MRRALRVMAASPQRPAALCEPRSVHSERLVSPIRDRFEQSSSVHSRRLCCRYEHSTLQRFPITGLRRGHGEAGAGIAGRHAGRRSAREEVPLQQNPLHVTGGLRFPGIARHPAPFTGGHRGENSAGCGWARGLFVCLSLLMSRRVPYERLAALLLRGSVDIRFSEAGSAISAVRHHFPSTIERKPMKNQPRAARISQQS